MIDDFLVVDATVHAFNFTASNFRAPFMPELVRMLYHFGFDILHPIGDTRYWLSFDEFQGLFERQPSLLEQVMFEESATDVAVYHGVPMYGLFGDGSSPIHIGEAVARRLPHRMFIYGDISPTHPDPNGWIDELSRKPNLIGVKFYPVDMVEGRIRPIRLDDEQSVMPLLARIRDKGIKVVAIHKAVPLGPLPRDLYGIEDLAPAIEAFPDLQFEIVHGGFAFGAETAALLERHENVWINLESIPCFVVNHADKFADILAPLLATGRADRIFWSTGATGMHPRPAIEGFNRFQMPSGYPRLTDEMKAGIFGLNFARLHAWDVPALQASCARDAYGLQNKDYAYPWTAVRVPRRPV